MLQGEQTRLPFPSLFHPPLWERGTPFLDTPIHSVRIQVLLPVSRSVKEYFVRCQRCPKPATLHITEVLGPKTIEELHFCEECAQKHLYEPTSPAKSADAKVTAELDDQDIEKLNALTCPNCGITFKDFRSTGRLGCPQDYEVFRKQLVPLLDNIHGEQKHQGKSPRFRGVADRKTTTALGSLRRQLQGAIAREDYEQAAQLRDKIRCLETAG